MARFPFHGGCPVSRSVVLQLKLARSSPMLGRTLEAEVVMACRAGRSAVGFAAVALGIMPAMPAWADHSTSTGINCSNFAFQEDAQSYFNTHPGDPEGLDGPPGATSSGIPNVACEDLPRRGSSTTVVTIPQTTITTPTTVAGTGSAGSSPSSGAASGAAATTTSTTVAASAAFPIASQATTSTTLPAAIPSATPATATTGRSLALTG